MASGQWVVGGETVYLDATTVFSGTPLIGQQVHIEGALAGGGRRVARLISASADVLPLLSPSARPSTATLVPLQPIPTPLSMGVLTTTPPVGTATSTVGTAQAITAARTDTVALPTSTKVVPVLSTPNAIATARKRPVEGSPLHGRGRFLLPRLFLLIQVRRQSNLPVRARPYQRTQSRSPLR